MTHIMLDLETWGTAPGCALRSIGAVQFELSGEIKGEFYRNIAKDSCLKAGLIIDPATERWWQRQSPEAQAALENDPEDLAKVATEFHLWCLSRGPFVWSHGANFDEPIWCAAARAVGQKAPWYFWDVRDTRTIFAIADIDTRSLSRTGTHHNALDDAKHQARLVQLAWAKIEGKPAMATA